VNADNDKIKVTLVRSPIGAKPNHRACVKGLGLKRLNQSVLLKATPAVRGMIRQVDHLVRSEVA
jgi:large subunit ribosomal protein L30